MLDPQLVSLSEQLLLDVGQLFKTNDERIAREELTDKRRQEKDLFLPQVAPVNFILLVAR